MVSLVGDKRKFDETPISSTPYGFTSSDSASAPSTSGPASHYGPASSVPASSTSGSIYGPSSSKKKKIYVPVKEYPGVNFLGARQLEIINKRC